MYPQVILFALALWKHIPVRLISIVLSGLGFCVAVYHHALQMLPSGSLPCPASGPSCSQITLLEYGYITYPLMAATLFAFLIVLMVAHKVRSQ
jgi:disulfide bond formation protein DsbB